MKLLADSGLWSTGPTVSPAPAVAVLEVSGAVLAWTIDDSTDPRSTRITFTDVIAAEWLWRLVGVHGHAALVSAMNGRGQTEGIDLGGIDLEPATVNLLRRLAVGHWLRRWWPASAVDNIATLDHALLDGEIALLTQAAQDYFTDDTLDSDVIELLAPHRSSFTDHEADGDPRVVDLVLACVDLAAEVGAWDSSQSAPALEVSNAGRRDDYALAAGTEPGRRSTTATIAGGVASVNWIAVPPGMFDAADETIDWSVEMVGAAAMATVRVAPLGHASAAGIAVGLRSGMISGAGILDVSGRASMNLFDEDELPVAETHAWNHDWSTTAVTIGADLPDGANSGRFRQRVRDFARARLATPGADAFLAELLAAESDY